MQIVKNQLNKVSSALSRLNLTQIKLAIAFSLISLILHSSPLISFVVKNTSQARYLILSQVLVLQFLVIAFFANVLCIIFYKHIKILKTILISICITNSIAIYFINTFATILDKTMFSNVFNTKYSEASQLVGFSMVYYIFFYGIAPSYLIAKIKITKSTFAKKILAMATCLVLIIVTPFANSKTWLWFDKNAKHIGGLEMPFSYIINSVRGYKMIHQKPKIYKELELATFTGGKNKTLVVLVIGESARMQNFSLYGYNQNTNPLLSKDDVTILQNPSSCTTYTTGSIECMLSHLGSRSSHRTDFEPLPNYLLTHGVSVIWRSNNWGHPSIKTNLYKDVKDIQKEYHVKKNLNYDEVLLEGLEADIAKYEDSQNIFVVLHQSGSHGPSYNLKYPKDFEKFTPVCNSVEIQKCSKQELINGYDNTILYTDFILHSLITKLKQIKNRDVLMIYTSDHGESLGEEGFYLHGTPYGIAPDYQKKVPIILWFSAEFANKHKIDTKKLQARQNNSHDLIFHTITSSFWLKGGAVEQKYSCI
jgi:lipid A ethanolaminephosphotransferase